MGRSQETASKKDKEKRRAQKKREKAEKREERKANNNKGKSLEEMMVYLDEFGNITDTPPDPKKKVEINHEEIILGAAPIRPDESIIGIRKGVVTFFNEPKGYGFIQDSRSKESIFVHINQTDELIRERDQVQFEIEKSPKGLTAVRVSKI